MNLTRLLGVLSLPLLGACAILESDGGPRVTVDVTLQPLDLALGDTASIAITVRNSGDREVTVGSAGCNMDFFLSDPGGNAYSPAERVYCTLELRAPTVLKPGAAHRIDVFTTGLVLPQGYQGDPVMLAAGTYRVRPVISVHSGAENAVIVTSDPISVTFR